MTIANVHVDNLPSPQLPKLKSPMPIISMEFAKICIAFIFLIYQKLWGGPTTRLSPASSRPGNKLLILVILTYGNTEIAVIEHRTNNKHPGTNIKHRQLYSTLFTNYFNGIFRTTFQSSISAFW